MAKAIGFILGLLSLLYSILIVLNGWHSMSASVRIYALVVPALFASVALLGVLIGVRILIARLYHRMRGTRPLNEYAFLDGKSMQGLALPILAVSAIGLYATVEHFFG